MSTTRPFYERKLLCDDDEEVDDNSVRVADMTEKDLCPVDLLVLSVHQANYLHPACVGQVFPSFQTLESQFNLL